MLRQGMLLVRNRYSLISSGTEGGTVRAARMGLIGKAKERPGQVKQVIETFKKQGLVQTCRVVMKKLDSYSPLGYSSSGEVIEVAPDVSGFTAGDAVACGGSTANHAEIVAVPANLCVRLTPGADLQKAAYNTLGAVAMQGVRQAGLQIGETCAVIGLGLIGQLTGMILKAGGIKTVGIDVDGGAVDLAGGHFADLALDRGTPALDKRVDEFTGGLGVDAVIITAASRSLDPVNLAGRLARERGRVIIVGDVPTGFDREPHYFRKELDLRMSRSYGPGRYDPSYEEKGIDYPAGYVRWTENRNMQSFQNLIHTGVIDPSYLTSHIFDLDNAAEAYDLILKNDEPSRGILIRYETENVPPGRKLTVNPPIPAGKIGIGLIGSGSYAQSYLLPNIPGDRDVRLKGVMASSGTSSRSAAERFGFEFCTSDEEDIFGDSDINTIIIATRHDTHGPYVIKALQAGKHVYVEKPLCLNSIELDDILKIYSSPPDPGSPQVLMVGYNRRFSSLTEIIRENIASVPVSMIYRVNAGDLPAESWIRDADTGGGRIIGEACHFIDYLSHLAGSQPVSVYAASLDESRGLDDTLNISLVFKNGSIGTISYFANGSDALPKEYIEVYAAGVTAVLKDFREVEIYGKKKIFRKRLLAQDKGRKRALSEFLRAVREGRPAPILFEDIIVVTKATLKVKESLRTGRKIDIA